MTFGGTQLSPSCRVYTRAIEHLLCARLGAGSSACVFSLNLKQPCEVQVSHKHCGDSFECQHWARLVQYHPTESPQTLSSSHSHVWTLRPREESRRARGHLGHWCQSWNQDSDICFPFSPLPLHLPALVLGNGHFPSHFTLMSYKREGLSL